MAVNRKRITTKEDRDQDVISYCGSISGETFSSRHSRKAGSCSLRQRGIDVVAQKLRDFPFDDAIQRQPSIESKPKRRFNSSFHHFRLLVVMMGGLSFGLMILLRYNVSVAILNMVNQTALYMHEHPDRTVEDFLAEGYQLGGDFDWDNEIQNMIMSWYMIAYTLPQVASTKLGLIVGSRLTTPISLAICSLATLLTPVSAYWGWQWVIALRLINGIGASAVLPMMLHLIEDWMPLEEITLGLTLSNTLQAIISSSSPLIAGYLCSHHWSYAFYVPAVVALLFCIVWLLLITDRPDESCLISQQELDLIYGCNAEPDPSGESDNKEGKTAQECEPEEKNKPTTIDILRVPSFYAYLFCLCLHCSSFNGFNFILPAYLRQFLKISISENGLYCSIITCGSILAVMWPHPMLYVLQSKLKLSLTTSRRITYAIGCVVVAFTWIYVGSFHEFQLVLLFIGRCFAGCNDVVVTGSLMSNYAPAGLSSMAFSMVNTVGNFSVVFVSTLIGWYLDYTGQSRAGWFWILGGMGAAQLIMMVVFATLIKSDPIEFDKQTKRPAEVPSAVVCDNQQVKPEVAQKKVINPSKLCNDPM